MNPRQYFWFLSLCTFSVLLLSIRAGDLSGYDDALYADEARHMLRSGNWLDLKVNGEPNMETPPLFVCMQAAAMAVFGINDYAAKFPAALCGCVTILLVPLIARQLYPSLWLPIVAMLALLTSQYFIKYATHAMTDVPFGMFFSIAIWSYLKAEENPRFWLVFGLAGAAANLARPVVGLLLFAVAGIHLLISGAWRAALKWHAVAGVLIALAAPGGWYFRNFQLYGSAFVDGNTAFVLGKARPAGDVVRSLLEYPKLLLKYDWPWLPATVIGLVSQMQALRTRKRTGLAAVWALVVFGAMSCAGAKVLRYLIPAFPALAILAAAGVSQIWSDDRIRSALKWIAGPLALAFLYISIFPRSFERGREMRALAPAVAGAIGSDRPALFTWGGAHWELQHQLIWYGDRNCELVLDKGRLRQILRGERPRIVIIDKDTFAAEVAGRNYPGKEIARSGRFICWSVQG